MHQQDQLAARPSLAPTRLVMMMRTHLALALVQAVVPVPVPVLLLQGIRRDAMHVQAPLQPQLQWPVHS